jgi:hypothetical protein
MNTQPFDTNLVKMSRNGGVKACSRLAQSFASMSF